MEMASPIFHRKKQWFLVDFPEKTNPMIVMIDDFPMNTTI